jgi:type II secretory pathway pseudopilin PulG
MTDQLAVPTWREEARRDRLTRAQIDQEREAARLRLRIDGRRAELAVRREERQARDADQRAARQARAAERQQARKARGARRERRLAWLREHSTDLLFVPVIAVPAVLAWMAMAAFGVQVYGPAGLTLPAFSEGAMWAFAGAVTLTRHRHPGKPVWHLRLGTVVFAAEGAALNFAHGMTAPVGGLHPGPGVGAVMAVVSVAGVTAHQLVTAGPRRSRAEKQAARLARARERREVRARRDAIRRATAVLEADGNVRLVCQPRPATGRRGWAARLTRRDRIPHAGLTLLPPGPSCPWPRPAPVILPAPAPARAGGVPDGRTRTAPARRTAPGSTRARTAGTPAARTRAVTEESAEVHYAAELSAGLVPSRRRIKAELHVGQDRAAQIHDHLAAVATSPRQLSGRTT